MRIEQFAIQWAPELILLIGACVSLLVGLAPGRQGRSAASLVAFIVILLALLATWWSGAPSGTQAAFGLWLTSLSYYARWIALAMGGLVVLVNWRQPAAQEHGEYMAMVLFSLLGVLLTASANDLVVLFFAIELVSIPTYVLIALSREDKRASEAAVKYFFLGALAAAILAYGLSFLYGAAGTTTLHTVVGSTVTSTMPSGDGLSGLALVGLLLVIAGLAFKVAAVPLHFYVADVYEGAASPVTGMLGFVPKFAGFVALVKIFAACQWDLPATVMWVIWACAVATMTAGNVLALLQKSAKRILAYSSVSHTGYMLIALLVGPVAGLGPMRDGVAALLFYIAVYGAMNLGAFALLTAFRSGDRDVETLDDLGGLATRAPLAAFALAVCIFSLMGFPPTAGFLGKLYIFASAFSLGSGHPFQGPIIALAIIGVINSAIGAAYYLRIVAAAYIGHEVEPVVPSGGPAVRVGLAFCAIPLLILFAWPAALVGPARQATVAVQHAIIPSASRLTAADESTSYRRDAAIQAPTPAPSHE